METKLYIPYAMDKMSTTLKKEVCPMKLNDYARNHNKRKDYVQQYAF